jgi:O-antigen ligase
MINAQTHQVTTKKGYPRFTPYTFSLARLLLVATLFGATLAFGALIPYAWTALGLAAGLGLFLWALGSVQQGTLRLIWTPLFIPLSMFFLLGVAQYTARLTLDRSETRQALAMLAVNLAFFFLAVQLFAEAPNATLRAFGLAVLVFAGSLGLFAILQDASGAHRLYGVQSPSGGFFGPYVNRDHYAGLMEMLVPVAVLCIAGRRGNFSLEALAWRVSAAMLALASLFLSGSRGGLLALSAEIAIVAIALRPVGARTKQRRRLAMAAAIALLGGVMVFAFVDPGWAAKKLGSVAYAGNTTQEWAASRKKMARDALSMWRAHPLLGVGLGDFETAYPRYQSFASDDWIDHAHNDYVEALAETGLVGSLFILSALALFLRLAFRDWGHALRSEAGWTRLGAALGCSGMLLHSFLDYNLHIPANAAWFAVLAGIATTGRVSNSTQDRAFKAD